MPGQGPSASSQGLAQPPLYAAIAGTQQRKATRQAMQPFSSGGAKRARPPKEGLAPGEAQPKEAREGTLSPYHSVEPEERPRTRHPSEQEIEGFEERLRQELVRAEAEEQTVIADADL